MSTVDERIVSMKLNNQSLLAGAKSSKKALDDMNKSVDNLGKNKGAGSLGQELTGLRGKFSALQVAAVTAVATITNKMVNAGLAMAKAMTLDPIMDGYREYEKLLTSTQTIMANTGAKSKVVSRYLGELNQYADQTVYNFGQMADSIGKFTAAGVNLKMAVPAIKGMANSAALFGSDANQLNTAMYQMSQALATGTIRLMDWNSLANAGMGGENMRKSLIATAEAVGVSSDMLTSAQNDFRGSLQEGWLSGKVFTKTMEVMAGQAMPKTAKAAKKLGLDYDKLTKQGKRYGDTVAFSIKQLTDKGYSLKAAKELHRLSAASIESATKIKTFTQMIDVIKESIGSGWAQVFGSLFGNINQAKKLWTTVGNAITGVIDRIFDGMTGMLKTWNKAGGYTSTWRGFGNIFKALGNIIAPFVALFKSFLPASKDAGKGLVTFSKGFEKVTAWIEKATRGAAVLTPVFQGVGKVVRFVLSAIVSLIKGLAQLGGTIIGDIQGKFMQFVGNIQKVINKIDEVTNIKDKFKSIGEAFREIEAIIQGNGMKALQKFGLALAALFTGDFSGFKNLFGEAVAQFSGLKLAVITVIETIQSALSDIRENSTGIFDPLLGGADKVLSKLKTAASAVGGLFSGFKTESSTGPGKAFTTFEASAGQVKNTAASVSEGVSTLGDILAGFWDKIKTVASTIGSAIGGMFSKVTGAVGGMDRFDWGNIINIGMLGLIYANIKKFREMFEQLIPDFRGIGENIGAAFGQLTDTLKTMQQGVRANIIKNIAIGVAALAASLLVLSFIPIDKLKVGIGALSVLIGILVAAMFGLSKIDGGIGSLSAIAIAMGGMAVSLLILAGAVAAFGNMPIDTLTQGGVAIAAALGLLVAQATVISLFEGQFVAAAFAITAFAIATTILAGAVMMFGNMSIETLTKGIAAVALVMISMAAAVSLISGAALPMVAASIAIGIFSVTLTAFLATILAFAAVDGGSIFDGMKKIVLVLLALAAAAVIVAAPLAALGIALTLVGVGVLAIGAGIALLGAGVAVLAASGTAAIAVVSAAIVAFVGLFPLIAIQVVSALISVLETLAQAMPKIKVLLYKILVEIVDFIIILMPVLEKLISKLIDLILHVIIREVPKIVQAAVDLILALAEGLTKNAPLLAQAAVDLISSLLDSMVLIVEQMIPKIFQVVLAIINAIADAVEVYTPQIMKASASIGFNLIKGILKGLIPQPVLDALKNLGSKMIEFFKGLFGIKSPSKLFTGFGKDIIQGLINGIKNLLTNVVDAIRKVATLLVTGFINVVRSLPSKAVSVLSSLGNVLGRVFGGAFDRVRNIVSNGIHTLLNIISSIPGKIMSFAGKFMNAGADMLRNLVNGMTKGIKGAGGVVSGALDAILGGIRSFVNTQLIDRINRSLTVNWDWPGPGKINFAPNLPHLAKGTDNFGGGTAMVGEKGQELVVMPKGARVLTNKNTNNLAKAIKTVKSMGGQRINVSVMVESPKIVVENKLEARGRLGKANAKAENLFYKTVQALAKSVGQIALTKSEAKNQAESISKIRGAGNKLSGSAYNAIMESSSNNAIRLDAAKAKQKAYSQASKEEEKDAKELDREARKLRAQANKIKGKSSAAKARRAALENRAKAKELQADRNRNRADSLANRGDRAGERADKLEKKQKAAAEAKARREKYNKYIKDGDFQSAADMDAEDAANAAKKAQTKRREAMALRAQADMQKKSDQTEANRLRKQADDAAKKGDKAKAKRLRDQANALLARSKKDQASLNAQALAEEKKALKASVLASKEANNSVANQNKANAEQQKDLDYQLSFDAMTQQEKNAEYKRVSEERQSESEKAYAKAKAKLAEAANAKDAKAKAKLIMEGQLQLELARALKQESEDFLSNIQDGANGASGALGLTAEDIKAINDALRAPEMETSSRRVHGVQNMFEAYSKSLAQTLSAMSGNKEQPAPINLVQNNYSPTSLSTVDVYRQTKSLVASIK